MGEWHKILRASGTSAMSLQVYSLLGAPTSVTVKLKTTNPIEIVNRQPLKLNLLKVLLITTNIKEVKLH